MNHRLIALLSIFIGLTSCIKDNPQGKDIKVGESLPRFQVTLNDGSVVTDNSLIGDVSFIMFFHSSCPDCQQALPEVQHIYDEYAQKGVKFALISREEGVSLIEQYWDEKGYNMPYSAQNNRKVYNLFATSRIPRIYISDENGIIRYIFTDDPVPTYLDLKSSIESLIR